VRGGGLLAGGTDAPEGGIVDAESEAGLLLVSGGLTEGVCVTESGTGVRPTNVAPPGGGTERASTEGVGLTAAAGATAAGFTGWLAADGGRSGTCSASAVSQMSSSGASSPTDCLVLEASSCFDVTFVFLAYDLDGRYHRPVSGRFQFSEAAGQSDKYTSCSAR